MFRRMTRSRAKKDARGTTGAGSTGNPTAQPARPVRRTRSRKRAEAAPEAPPEGGFEERKMSARPKPRTRRSRAQAPSEPATTADDAAAPAPKPVAPPKPASSQRHTAPQPPTSSSQRAQDAADAVSMPPPPNVPPQAAGAASKAPLQEIVLTQEQLAAAKARVEQHKSISKSWTPGMSVKKKKEAMGQPSQPRMSLPSPAVVTGRLAKKLSFSSAMTPGHGLDAASGAGAGAGAAAAAAAQPKAKKAKKKKVELPRAGLQVHLRIRPWDKPSAAAESAAAEGEEPPPPAIDVVSDSTVRMNPPEASAAFKSGDGSGEYTFSHVWDQATDQEQLFENVIEPLVESAVAEGTNGLVFAYGMTNAGKTHTIMGEPSRQSDAAGIIPRAVEAVVDRVREYNGSSVEARQNGRVLQPHALADFRVTVSYLEIYNEHIYDLLAPLPKGMRAERQKLMLGPKKDRVVVKGLLEKRVTSVDSAITLMQQGSKARMAAETRLNSGSSRSHAVFTITLWRKADDAVSEHGRHWARLSIVDLAGSERGTRTRNTGTRLREAGSINNSVMLLMRCLQTMRINQKAGNNNLRVPFRETKLTYLFKDSLVGGGSGNTCMILCANPNEDDYDETLHVVKYGAMVQDITVANTTAELRWHVNKQKLGYSYDVDGRRIGPEERKAALLAAAEARRQRKRSSGEADLTETAEQDARRARKKGRRSKPKRGSRRTTTTRRKASTRASVRASVRTRQSSIVAGAAARPSTASGSTASGAVSSAMVVQQLHEQIVDLQSQLNDAWEAAAQVEERVRTEMANDMAARITELEEFHASKAEQQAQLQQSKISALMSLRDQRTATAKKQAAHAPRRDLVGTAAGGLRVALDFGSADGATSDGEGGDVPAGTLVVGDPSPNGSARDSGDGESGTDSEYDSEEDDEDMTASEGEDDEEVIEELRIQIHECEAEMDRMRQKHVQEMEQLKQQLVTAQAQVTAQPPKPDAPSSASSAGRKTRSKAKSKAMAGATKKQGKTDTSHMPNGSSPLVRAGEEDSEDAPAGPSSDTPSRLAETQAEVARLTEALEMAQTVLESATATLSKREQELAELRGEKESAEASLQAALETAEQAMNQVEQLRRDGDDNVEHAKAAQAEEFATDLHHLNGVHQRQLAEAIERVTAEQGEVRAELEAKHTALVEKMRAQHEAALASQQEEYEHQMQELKQSHARELEEALARARLPINTPATGTPKRRRLTQFTNSDLRRDAHAVSAAAARAGMAAGRVRADRDSFSSSSSGEYGSSPSSDTSGSSDGRSHTVHRPQHVRSATSASQLEKALQFAGCYTKAMMTSASGTPVSHATAKDENRPPSAKTAKQQQPQPQSQPQPQQQQQQGGDGNPGSATHLSSPPPVAPTRGTNARARFLMSALSPVHTRRQRSRPARYTPGLI